MQLHFYVSSELVTEVVYIFIWILKSFLNICENYNKSDIALNQWSKYSKCLSELALNCVSAHHYSHVAHSCQPLKPRSSNVQSCSVNIANRNEVGLECVTLGI